MFRSESRVTDIETDVVERLRVVKLEDTNGSHSAKGVKDNHIEPQTNKRADMHAGMETGK